MNKGRRSSDSKFSRKPLGGRIVETLSGGISKEEYRDIASLIAKNNSRSFTFVMEAGMILLIALFCVGHVPALENYFGKFSTVSIVFILILMVLIVLFDIYKKQEKFTLLFCYVVDAILFSTSIVLGPITNRDQVSTLFLILLFVLPILMTDLPWRILSMLAIASIIFVVFSLHCKSDELFIADTVNCIVAFTLSSLTSLYVQETKLSQLTLVFRTREQRDTDALTRLFTKTAGQRKITKRLQNGANGALIVFDLDNFKQINDQYGHLVGDEVLSAVGDLVRKTFRKDDILYRFGGDEFVIFLEGAEKEADVLRLVELLKEKIQTKFAKYGSITCSVGIAFNVNADNYETLFNNADKAVYAAKRSGKNQIYFF